MGAPRKYPEELRERAVRVPVDARREPATRSGALRRVGAQLGINPETLRNWVVQAEVDQGHRLGARRVAELEREVKELRRANEILRTASAFSPRRSSTADSGDRRLHRRAPRLPRGRADLPGPVQGWDSDRPEYVLRRENPGASR